MKFLEAIRLFLFGHPHDWREVSIGGSGYWDGHIHVIVMRRTLQICNRCGHTSAMAFLRCRKRNV